MGSRLFYVQKLPVIGRSKVKGSESAPLPITNISIIKIRSERFVLIDHPHNLLGGGAKLKQTLMASLQ